MVSEVLVGDVVLGADEYAGGAVVAAGDGDQEVGVLVQGLRILPDHHNNKIDAWNK